MPDVSVLQNARHLQADKVSDMATEVGLA